MKALVAAFAFLTRLPVWRGPLRDVELGRSVSFFPLVGLVLGFGLTGTAAALAGHMAPWLIAVLLAALLAALTGGLHLDGVADVFDALGGGRGDRARMLEIMRDSRIGAHGATALTLLLIAKVAALAQVAERHDLLALLAFPTIARWLAALLVVFFPYVRPEGLGRAFNGEAGRVQVAAATGIAAIVVGALGPALILPALGSAAVVLVFAFWLHRRLGGLDRRRLRGGDRAGRGRDAGPVHRLRAAPTVYRRLGRCRRRSHFRDMLLRSPGMAGPAIVHIEFKSSDFARTSDFYAKLFDWKTDRNASGMYMKFDGNDGPSGGWVRADLVQSPGPIAYLTVDDLATKLDEVEAAGRARAGAQLALRGRRRDRAVRGSRRQRARALAAEERRWRSCWWRRRWR